MTRNPDPKISYIRNLYAVQDALLSEIDAQLHAIGIPIHIGAEEGRLLQVLIATHGAKTIVEIGTLAGYSALWMARGLPEGGHVYTINKDPVHIALARGFFDRSEVGDRITMLEGDAQKMLLTLESKAPFDMVFIDADKISYNDYLDWAEKNVRTGGLIIADNTFLHDTIYNDTAPEDIAPTTWNAMRRFNERLADPKRYCSTIIPTVEGLSIAIKKF